MSVQLVENEIRLFLSTKEPEVICISGDWGVGKTFAWNRYLKDAKEARAIALKNYSYVSLFGLGTLDEVRYAIFENSVKSSDIGVEPNLKSLTHNAATVVNSLGRKAIPILQNVPMLKNYLGGLGPALFLSVREAIVCLDDLERRGEHLEIRDLLGLASSLREHRRCKVCLILNNEALEKSKNDFSIYFEKVVDTSLTFAPSAAEAVTIALPEKTKPNALLSTNCITLGIANIRLIRKTERLIRKVEPLVASFDPRVLEQAIHSLTLLAWSYYEPSKAPSIEFLRKRQMPDLFDLEKKEKVSALEASWNALLDVYHFRNLDAFDLVLLDGVRNGFFDSDAITARASELDLTIKAGSLNDEFWSSWGMLHDSFSNNQDEVLDAIYRSFRNGIGHISHGNMHATVQLFKRLGRKSQADELISAYMNYEREDPRFFDLDNDPFASEITDPEVRRAFKEKYESLAKQPDARAVLLSMAKMNGWNPQDIEILAETPVQTFYDIFKKSEGDDLRKIINACLQFDGSSNVSTKMKQISQRAREALARIGQESPMNAIRVSKFGVSVDGSSTSEDGA